MILARYILKEHVAPFFYALFVITFLFLVDFLIRILSSILSKGLGWRVVLEILVLNLAWMLALSIPMAVLVATLMAFGRFSSDNEITAMKSLGISPFRAMLPALIVACLLGAGLVYFNNDILPEANFRAAALRNDIGRKKPTALITPRTLIRDFENYLIWIERLDQATGQLGGVRIYSVEPGKPVRYTYADSASMEYANGGKSILIHLQAGENHFVDPKETANYVRVRFRTQDVAIDNVDATLERHQRSYRTDREMSIQEMAGIVKASENRLTGLRQEYREKIFDELRALDIVLSADTVKDVPPRLLQGKWWKDDPIGTIAYAEVKRQEKDKIYLIERYERREENELKEISQFMVEIHKKFSIPVACLVFVFIGVPLGIMARRGGIGTGVIYSVAFYLLYWVCMIRGEVLADRLIIRPWVAMWAPNIIVGMGGLFLVFRMARENYLNNISLPQKLFRLVWRRSPKGTAA
ncbi:MAG TPA: LptF/LptG family permease [Fibrobacteria bacterium]|nr:LptF/LptG family permease [Fibrobacteria bacterium]